jgi:hypothetical protein
MATREDKVVTITVKKDRVIVDPDEKHITIHDRFRWKSADQGRFTIEFKNASPFEKKTFSYDEAIRPRRHRQDATRAGTEYEYTVYDEGNRKNFKDPKVIVDDPT